MNAIAEPAILADHPLLTGTVCQEMIRQLRAVDSYGTYDGWSDAKVLDPFVITKERAREIPVVGDPDEIVMSRVKAYYNGLACLIEQRTGLMATPTISLSHEGFGRALIIVGHLVVTYKTLRDIHRFGFRTLEKLVEETDKIVTKATELVESHRKVAEL